MVRDSLGAALVDYVIGDPNQRQAEPTPQLSWFHGRLPGHAMTPLVPLPDVADDVGARSVWLKVEHQRFGLPSFKVLGASWAVYRCLERALGRELREEWEDIDGLRGLAEQAQVARLVAATDGNHGRAVARVARWLDLSAGIFVPEGTASSRIEAIRTEGASVIVVDGDYDAAVECAAAEADGDTWVVADTSWDGYTEVPAWISEGYGTLFAESAEQLHAAGIAAPTLALVPVGVGALALAALRSLDPSTGVVAVEPVGADCVTQSLRAGHLVTTPGPHRSAMAGLNCGTPSVLAWPTMRAGLTASVVITDEAPFAAMRLLSSRGLAVGETGAAALGALLAIADSAARLRELVHGADVLLLCTEGATDPDGHARIVGRPLPQK